MDEKSTGLESGDRILKGEVHVNTIAIYVFCAVCSYLTILFITGGFGALSPADVHKGSPGLLAASVAFGAFVYGLYRRCLAELMIFPLQHFVHWKLRPHESLIGFLLIAISCYPGQN